MRSQAEEVINTLFEYYLDNLDDIPVSFMENKYYSKFKTRSDKEIKSGWGFHC